MKLMTIELSGWPSNAGVCSRYDSDGSGVIEESGALGDDMGDDTGNGGFRDV